MTKISQNILQQIQNLNQDNFSDNDLDRATRYAQDLMAGLAKIRSYPQGVTIFGSACLPAQSKWCKIAEQLGAELAYNGHTVITGGGPSIMEAANKGAYQANGRSIGLNIQLPHEQHLNPYVTDSVEFNYFFARKVMLTFSSKVFVFFPGGFGTLDELSEILILMQEKKMPQMPIFLFGKTFWRDLDKFFKSKMLRQFKTLESDAFSLYKITDDINEIVDAANQIGHIPIEENLYDRFTHA